jgi:hemerythrin-like domain-containing protein
MMTHEHEQIRSFAARVEADRDLLRHELSRDQANEVRCHLFALEGLLRAHIEREERYVLPLLDTAPVPRSEQNPAHAGRVA